MSGAIDIPQENSSWKHTQEPEYINKNVRARVIKIFTWNIFFPFFNAQVGFFVFFIFLLLMRRKLTKIQCVIEAQQMGPLHNFTCLHETFHASIIDVIRDCCRNCTWRSVFWSGRSNILPNIFVLIGQERWYFVFVAILVTILW